MNTTLTRNPQQHLVSVTAGAVKLEGNLVIPDNAKGIILFVHGSGSSRHSRCNRHVARILQQADLATLSLDLLTPEEEQIDLRTQHFCFDIKLLAARIVAATDWLTNYPHTKHLKIAYFGASTGGCAVLQAAAQRPDIVQAIISHCGQIDVADAALPLIKAPTLLIVDEYDKPIIAMNEDALAQMRSPKQLEIIPQASHLFEEPSALDTTAQLASQWFNHQLQHRSQNNIEVL